MSLTGHRNCRATAGKKHQSWSNVYSISRPQLSANNESYDKHLFENEYHGRESKYGKDVHVQELELFVFNKGLGFQKTKNQLFLFAKFDCTIGTVMKPSKRIDSHILKLQVDRISRPEREYIGKEGNKLTRKQGYNTKIHGFPISENELQADFPAGATMLYLTQQTI